MFKLFSIFIIFLSTATLAANQYSSDKEILSKSFIKQAIIHIEGGLYRKSQDLIIQAIEIDKTIYDNVHPKTADDFSLLATVLSKLGENNKAKSFFLQSQQIRKKIFHVNHIILTDNLFGLAIIEKKQSFFEQSLTQHKIILNKRNKNKNNSDIITSLLEISDLQITLAYFNSAKLTIRKAKEHISKNYHKNHPFHMLLLKQESLVMAAEGKYQLAKKYDKRILDKLVKRLGRKNILVADTLMNIAKRMNVNEKSALAIPLLNEALEIYNKELGVRSLKSAFILSYLSSAKISLADYHEANKLNQRSSNIVKSLGLNINHQIVANNLINRAKIHASKKQYNNAHQDYLDAQMILEAIYRSNHPKVAILIANRAELFVMQSDHQKAKNLYIKAIDILKPYFNSDHPLIMNVTKKYDAFTEKALKL